VLGADHIRSLSRLVGRAATIISAWKGGNLLLGVNDRKGRAEFFLWIHRINPCNVYQEKGSDPCRLLIAVDFELYSINITEFESN
jgi:hypothetical protein